MLKSGYMAAAQRAGMAVRVTRMVEHGVPTSEAMELELDGVGQGANHSDPSAPPPLLKWALSPDVDDQSRPAVTKMVAEIYDRACDRKARIWGTVASATVGILVAGVLVFGYSTTVFLAMTELLRDFALKGAPSR